MMKMTSDLHRDNNCPHFPVMLSEVITNIQLKNGGTYLDCTFGAGGYTRAILQSANCNVYSIDQDQAVTIFSDLLQNEFGDRFHFIESNFADIAKKLPNIKFDGIVLDLGVSSMQLDQAERGFSFMRDGPLDMRMSSSGIKAAEFIATATEKEIADVIYRYGQEVQSRAIAHNIVKNRAENKIDTTLQLADIVRNAMHYRKGKIDPATKTFQAIRIFINKELDSLEQFLKNLNQLLLPGGRIIVVSFHSLEDSIVKNFFNDNAIKKIAKSKYCKEPKIIDESKWLEIINKKALTPSREEIIANPRSRSAKLRIAQKVERENAA